MYVVFAYCDNNNLELTTSIVTWREPRHSDNSNADWKRRCSVWPTGVIWLRPR